MSNKYECSVYRKKVITNIFIKPTSSINTSTVKSVLEVLLKEEQKF